MNVKSCFQVRTKTNVESAGILFVRLVAGAAFVLHGWGKIQNPMAWMPPEAPVPGVLQLLAAVAEFGGGIAWILGLLTPLASLGIAFTMFGAIAMHAIVRGDPFVSAGGGPAYELALMYFSIAILFMTNGPGEFSLDRKVFGRR